MFVLVDFFLLGVCYMKKIALITLGAATILGIHSGMTVQAQSDELIKERPKSSLEINHAAYVPSLLPTTEAAINNFVTTWIGADAKVKALEEKESAGQALNAYEQVWLAGQAKHSYEGAFEKRLLKRAEFYKRAHNWNGNNEKDRVYSDVNLPAHVNSYGYDALDGMNKDLVKAVKDSVGTNHENLAKQLASIVEGHQSHIVNEELRSYANETVRYAAIQAVNDKAADVPVEPASEHKVDLWKAIQGNK